MFSCLVCCRCRQPAANSLIIGKPVGFVLFLDIINPLNNKTEDGDMEKTNFLSGITSRCSHRWIHSFTWAMYFDGVKTSMKLAATALKLV